MEELCKQAIEKKKEKKDIGKRENLFVFFCLFAVVFRTVDDDDGEEEYFLRSVNGSWKTILFSLQLLFNGINITIEDPPILHGYEMKENKKANINLYWFTHAFD